MASGAALCDWTPLAGLPPGTATIDFRNNHPTRDFDASTEETMYVLGRLPASYGGGGLTVTLPVSMTSATSGGIVFGASIERLEIATLDTDADSFATEQLSSTVTVSGTSGVAVNVAIALSSGANMDSLVAGEWFRLKLARKVANAGDTATGDAEILGISLVET